MAIFFTEVRDESPPVDFNAGFIHSLSFKSLALTLLAHTLRKTLQSYRKLGVNYYPGMYGRGKPKSGVMINVRENDQIS